MRRGSIARMMTAIGLSSLALVLLRGWLGPENWFGFLGLLGFVVLVAWIGWLVAAGALRRFFAGFGFVGPALWIAVLIWPEPILDFCGDQLITRAMRWFKPEPNRATTDLELTFFEKQLFAKLNIKLSRLSENPPKTWFGEWGEFYAGCPDVQAWLLIPPAALATLGGLIGVAIRPRPTTHASPIPSP
jgi:hypothetical protein